jgi:hypothetical protein
VQHPIPDDPLWRPDEPIGITTEKVDGNSAVLVRISQFLQRPQRLVKRVFPAVVRLELVEICQEPLST